MTLTALPRAGHTPAAVLVTVFIAAAIAGCSAGDLTLPDTGANDLHLTVVSGNQQTGTVGEPLAQPVVVEVKDQQGHAVSRRPVAFVVLDGPAEAVLMPDTAFTSDKGRATGRWIMGMVPGAYHAEVRIAPIDGEQLSSGLPKAQLSASAEAGPPDTLKAVSDTDQFGRSGEPVKDSPTVRVVDRFGNPVSGVTVSWKVIAGEGTVSSPTVATDADGRATVTWTLGKQFGVQQLAASVAGSVYGSPVVFSATVFL